eukprot:97189-Amphidinium_carterae.1
MLGVNLLFQRSKDASVTHALRACGTTAVAVASATNAISAARSGYVTEANTYVLIAVRMLVAETK